MHGRAIAHFLALHVADDGPEIPAEKPQAIFAIRAMTSRT
jgi:hypothetical protein